MAGNRKRTKGKRKKTRGPSDRAKSQHRRRMAALRVGAAGLTAFGAAATVKGFEQDDYSAQTTAAKLAMLNQAKKEFRKYSEQKMVSRVKSPALKSVARVGYAAALGAAAGGGEQAILAATQRTGSELEKVARKKLERSLTRILTPALDSTDAPVLERKAPLAAWRPPLEAGVSGMFTGFLWGGAEAGIIEAHRKLPPGVTIGTRAKLYGIGGVAGFQRQAAIERGIRTGIKGGLGEAATALLGLPYGTVDIVDFAQRGVRNPAIIAGIKSAATSAFTSVGLRAIPAAVGGATIGGAGLGTILATTGIVGVGIGALALSWQFITPGRATPKVRSRVDKERAKRRRHLNRSLKRDAKRRAQAIVGRVERVPANA